MWPTFLQIIRLRGVIIYDYCAQHTQETDGSWCWEPVYNAIIEASMTSKLIGIVEFSPAAISIFHEATSSSGNSLELAWLDDDRKFTRTHVYVHTYVHGSVVCAR